MRNAGGRYPKTDFALDFTTGQLTCPAGVSMPFQPGTTVDFPKHTCAACPIRPCCTTTSSHGRSVAIHPDGALLAELREYQAISAGRAQLRERVKVSPPTATTS